MIAKPFPRLAAALTAAQRGWPVFPLHPFSKYPAVRDWERRATCDPDQITRWFLAAPFNIGIACGPACLVVLDLDAARSQPPPEWAEPGVTHGRDVLRLLAARAGQPDPVDTYTVATPSGQHRYFHAPADRELRNTTGTTGAGLGRLIDTRAAGGTIVAAGSVRRINGTLRRYRILRDTDPIELPPWLLTALTPPPIPPRAPTPLPAPGPRLDAYLRAALDGETATVARAAVGTRAHTLFRSAAHLGELVGAGVLDQTTATEALLAAAAATDTPQAPFTHREANGHITNGITRGRRTPASCPSKRTVISGLPPPGSP